MHQHSLFYTQKSLHKSVGHSQFGHFIAAQANTSRAKTTAQIFVFEREFDARALPRRRQAESQHAAQSFRHMHHKRENNRLRGRASSAQFHAKQFRSFVQSEQANRRVNTKEARTHAEIRPGRSVARENVL